MTKEYCDICFKEIEDQKGMYVAYNTKRFIFGRWVQCVICDECLTKLRESNKNKNKNQRS